MKNKRIRTLIGIGIVIVMTIGYLCWPEKKVPAPENMRVLDKTRTEHRDFYLTEEHLEEDMKNVVEPYLNEHKKTGYFQGYDGEELYYEQYLADEEKGHIVVVHGFTDATYKFREVMYYFLKSGYSVSALDHRGHGYSYRSIENPCKVSIQSFDEYTDDLKIFVSDIVRPTMHSDEKLFAYAHSMGGCVTALLLEEDSTIFDAAVLTSPMMEIEFGGIPNHLARAISTGAALLGMEEDYTLGSGDYVEEYDFEGSSYTSKARYYYVFRTCAGDVNYQTNGGTYRWLKAADEATKKVCAQAERYITDTLLFQAEKDTTVGPNGQNEFVTKASNVQPILVEDAKHSILFTENETFIPYMNTILAFYEEHLK